MLDVLAIWSIVYMQTVFKEIGCDVFLLLLEYNKNHLLYGWNSFFTGKLVFPLCGLSLRFRFVVASPCFANLWRFFHERTFFPTDHCLPWISLSLHLWSSKQMMEQNHWALLKLQTLWRAFKQIFFSTIELLQMVLSLPLMKKMQQSFII